VNGVDVTFRGGCRRPGRATGVRGARARSLALVLAVPLFAVTTPSVGSTVSDAPRVSSGARASWGPEEVVADTAFPTSEQDLPAVVRVRPGGSAVAAWIADIQASNGPLMVARRRSDGHWTAPLQLVGAPKRGFTAYDVAVGPPGFASVVWQQRVGDRWRVKESHLRSGTWTAAQALGTGTGPRVTIDGRRTTTVVWSGRGIRSARRAQTGPWRFAAVTRSGTADLLRISSNTDGDLVVAWLHDALVSSSLRRHGARWSGTRTWRPARRDHPNLTGLQTAVGAGGRALVVWSTSGVWREAQHEYANYLAWSRSTTSGTWSPSRILTRSLGEDGGELTLSMNGSGAALAAWRQMHRSDSPSRVWAARFRPDGTWGAPLRVASSHASRPAAFMDRRGKAHVVAQSGRRVFAFTQSSGHPWGTGTIIASGHLFEATGRGESLIALYAPRPGSGLRAVARSSPR
jgi:hypothetical protein